MITKKVRKSNKSKYKHQSYEDLEKLGLGSWLKENAGTIGMVAGAGIGTLIAPGIGTTLGASIGGSVGGGVQNNAMQDKALDAQNAQIAQQNSYNQVQEQFKNLQAQNPQQFYGATMKCGGRLRKNGGPVADNPVYNDQGQIIGMNPTTGWEGQPRFEKGYDSTLRPHSEPVTTLQSIVRRNEPFVKGTAPSGLYRDVTTRDSEGVYNTKSYNETSFDSLKVANPTLFKTNSNFAGIVGKRMGGTLNYGGQLHEGPDGGVPVDKMGNPNSTNPSALVEKGEVMYKGKDNQPYIFSDTLSLGKNKTFAKEAKTIQGKYRMRLGKNMVERNDAISMKGYQKDMESLQQKQEMVRELNGMNQSQPQMRKGGRLPKYNGLQTNNMFLPNNYNVLPEDQLFMGVNTNLNLSKADTSLALQQSNIDTSATPPNYQQSLSGYKGQSSNTNDNINWGTNTGMDNTSLLGLAAPIAGNIIGMIGNKKRRNKGRITLNESSATPQGINLERERASAREQANLTRANTSRALKSGTSAQEYMANVGAANIGIQRGLGQQLGESLQKEEMYNNQLAQQTVARQNQMKGLKMQADMYNSQLDTMNDAQKQQYINNMLNSVNQYASERSRAKDRANAYDMMNPDYYTEQEKLPFLQSLYKVPKRRYRVKNPNK